MFLRTLSIFSSLGVMAVIPWALPRNNGPQVFQLDTLKGSFKASSSQQELKQDVQVSNRTSKDDFFDNYCKNINKDMIVCKNKESEPWPVFYYSESKPESKGVLLRVKSFTFQIINSYPVLDIELDNGENRRIDNFPTGWGLENFDREALIPEVDCVTLDDSGGALTNE